jgi:hypothetical protein
MIKLLPILQELKLDEKISSIVYHYTTVQGVDGILTQNKFRLSDNLVPDEDLAPYAVNPDKYKYYMSVARTRVPGYSRISRDSYMRSLPIRLELDGDKLNTRYKGKPFDYFKAFIQNAIKRNEYDEYEDRIYHTDMYIPNATSYIKRIDISLDEANEAYKALGVKKMLNTVVNNALTMNIPTYLYSSDKDFYAQLRGTKVEERDQLTKML